MSNFTAIKKAVSVQMDIMKAYPLFRTDVSKDDLWNTYLDSFAPGTNPIFKERTEHDCQCCKQFIRATGNMVAIINNKVVSIWDVTVDAPYQIVVDALALLVKSARIKEPFYHYENSVGTDCSHQQTDTGIVTWNHFHHILHNSVINKEPGSTISEQVSNKEVLQRSLYEITDRAIEIVLDLINQDDLYRGAEHKSIVQLLKTIKGEYDKYTEQEKDNYLWLKALELGGVSKIRNTVIGTLLTDVSDGVELDKAVASFEVKTAPEHYKRPRALITKGMIDQANKTITELGIETALYRRHSVMDDVSINNVLFANREVKKSKGLMDSLMESVVQSKPNLDKVDEVSIKDFIENILPNATKVEALVENTHVSNLMTLVSPVNADAPNVLKWDNNFTWSYNGDVADSSMKNKVKAAGGNVTGFMRFSIQWNDNGDNKNDLDAHCLEPDGNLIYYPKARQKQPSSGVLDVDITSPGNKVAVENITWGDKDKIQTGIYTFLVHNYAHHGGTSGFTAEIEYDGKIHHYEYSKALSNQEKVTVASIDVSKNGIKIINSLAESSASKLIWGVNTETFQDVSMIMLSPNYWDDNTVGNKHWFFILKDCLNPDSVRGFYNEYLNNDLNKHRKVFETLASKTKAEMSENQLSGVGFSSTKRNHVYLRVSGSFNRTIKVNF